MISQNEHSLQLMRACLFFQTKTVLAGSLEEALNFRVNLWSLREPKSGISDQNLG